MTAKTLNQVKAKMMQREDFRAAYEADESIDKNLAIEVVSHKDLHEYRAVWSEKEKSVLPRKR